MSTKTQSFNRNYLLRYFPTLLAATFSVIVIIELVIVSLADVDLRQVEQSQFAKLVILPLRVASWLPIFILKPIEYSRLAYNIYRAPFPFLVISTLVVVTLGIWLLNYLVVRNKH